MAYLNDVLLSVLENRRPIEDYVYTHRSSAPTPIPTSWATS